MVLQALVAPVPSFLITFANGLAFGVFWGWMLSLFGHVLAAAVCFGISRALGRVPVEVLVGKTGLESADRWFARWGVYAVFVGRLLPGVAFDAISYAAGLTRMRFRSFIAATALGIFPQTFLYSYLGRQAPEYVGLFLVLRASSSPASWPSPSSGTGGNGAGRNAARADEVGHVEAREMGRISVMIQIFDQPLEHVARRTGSLIAITGSMFSGKTEELIRRVRRALYARRSVQVFKQAIDTRSGRTEIRSHNGVPHEAIAVSTSEELLEGSTRPRTSWPSRRRSSSTTA